MRSAAIWTSVLLLAPSILASDDYSPFLSPLSNPFYESEPDSLRFAKRQNCQNGDVSCSSLGAPGTCCPVNTNCQVDGAGHVACCSVDAVCTGSVKGLSSTASGTGTSNAFVAGSVATSTTNSGSSTSSFFFGSTTATTTTSAVGVITTGNTVPNAPYAFYIIPTTFSAAAECSSYYSGCQSQFTSCTSALGVGVNGVTVSGNGGGISVNGVSATGAAASICSGLSTAACFGLQLNYCATIPGAAGTVTTGNGNTFVTGTGAAATRRPGGYYEIGMGVAVGVAGVLI